MIYGILNAGASHHQTSKKVKAKILILAVMILALSGFDQKESRVITGRVTSGEDGRALPRINVAIKGTSVITLTDSDGRYSISMPGKYKRLEFSFIGLKTKEIKLGKSSTLDVVLDADTTDYNDSFASTGLTVRERVPYHGVNDNVFHEVMNKAVSTFPIDVNTDTYRTARLFINNGMRPPEDFIRIEEMINYFEYDYDQPDGDELFTIVTETSTAPWNEKNKLVSVGLQGKSIPTENLPASNLVFLIDVSGSMSDPNKLPLLKASFKMLVNELREQDDVSIVVYAGAAGLVLKPTSGADKERIIVAMDNLQAGGSTAGGAGITLAYKIARENFKVGGNNRVILATDGDFNVGASDNQSMEELIEEKRKDGIFLTVLGYGMGNYKDSKMEILADKGNGNYAYIDNLVEARKVLVNEFGGTLFTIAKDVKLQVEFNPAKVKAYRLIGYENRMLKSEDFNNDKKDAGELGSGHTVTALYEIIPTGVESEFYKVDELKYQKTRIDPSAADSKELMTVKFRYKKPDGNESNLIVHPLVDNMVALENTSDNFRWAASVAAFGMLLRESEYVSGYSYDKVIELAEGARGKDKEGYRIDFINLAKSFGSIASRH
jgi:Ca-activated chloride channel family protein